MQTDRLGSRFADACALEYLCLLCVTLSYQLRSTSAIRGQQGRMSGAASCRNLERIKIKKEEET